MSLEISVRDALHTIDLYLYVASVGLGVGHLVNGLLVDLHAVYRESRSSVQFLVTDVTLEVLGFLMLNQNLLIIKLSVTIPRICITLVLSYNPHHKTTHQHQGLDCFFFFLPILSVYM